MPIYAYRCTKCGAEEEHIQRFSDPPMKKCEECGGKLEKLVSAAAFHLKGGGWYKDGYASAKADGGSAKGSEGGGESSSTTSTSSESAGSGTESKSSEPKVSKGDAASTKKKAAGAKKAASK